MAKISIGELHAVVSASASPYINELKRAETQTAQTTSRLDAQWAKFQKKLDRKWGAAGIGMSVMKGLGIGGGMAAAQHAAELVAAHWKKAAEAAQDIEKWSERTLELTKEKIALDQSPEQKLTQARLDAARARAQFNQANEPRTKSVWTNTPNAAGGIVSIETQVPRSLTDEERRQRREATQLLMERENALQKLENAQKKIDQARASAQGQERVKMENEAYKLQQGIIKDVTKATDEQSAANEREVETIRAQINPMQRLERELERIRELTGGPGLAGGLSEDEAWAAKVDVWTRMAELSEGTGKDMAAWKEVLDVSPELEKNITLGQELGMTFSSAFEDAIVEGKKFSEMLYGLAQDVLRLFVRQTITAPMANWLGGAFTGMGLGGARAAGGPVSGGTPYLVGERGPELFVPGASGSVVSAAATAGAGGSTMHFTYNFASGVTRKELAAILPAVVKASADTVADRVLRGGNYRKVFS